MRRSLSILVAAVLVFGGTYSVDAGIIFNHLGSANPTTEGWTRIASGSGTSEGAITDGGVDAWSIDDNSTGAFLTYAATPTDAQIAQGLTEGWVLRMRLRVVDAPDSAVRASVSGEYATGDRRFTMLFGSESDGDQIVRLWDGGGASGSDLTAFGEYVLEDLGSGYHTYELDFDPLAGSADLFVDGIERISDYAGHTSNTTGAGKRVNWGANDSLDTGQGNWNQVQWEINSAAVPEPSSLALLCIGAAGVIGLCRRRKHCLGE